MNYLNIFIVLIYTSTNVILCLDNGLAKTPPMGWLAWERFQCNINCDADPSNCISERLFMQMADRLVMDGYRDAGYEYVNIDDCWMAPSRDRSEQMVADPIRFPRGIKFLADYMHDRGLKLGIYQDYGIKTCMGYPGSMFHVKQDAEKFAEWEIDMLKLDACHSRLRDMDWGYIHYGIYLNRSASPRRPILFSCSWPYYELIHQIEPDYELISFHCNMWRNYHDIHDSWKSIEETIEFFGDNQEVLSPFIGPGHWADPDMLMIGNHHLTMGQSRIQMAVWSMIPAPLLMSNDLRDIKKEAKEILLNKKVIAINQDILGIPGKRIYKEGMLEVWRRKVSPIVAGENSFALLFINKEKEKKAVIKFSLTELGLNNTQGYIITELFSNTSLGILKVNQMMNTTVPPMDAIFFHCQFCNICK